MNFELERNMLLKLVRPVITFLALGSMTSAFAGFPPTVPIYILTGASGGANCSPANALEGMTFSLPAASMCNGATTACNPGYAGGHVLDGPVEGTGGVFCQPIRAYDGSFDGLMDFGTSSTGCPQDSTLTGSLCECNTGFREKGTECVPTVDPGKQNCCIGHPIDA